MIFPLIKRMHFHGTFMVRCFFTRGKIIPPVQNNLTTPSFPSMPPDKVNWLFQVVELWPLGTLTLSVLDAGLRIKGLGLWLRLCPFLLIHYSLWHLTKEIWTTCISLMSRLNYSQKNYCTWTDNSNVLVWAK